MKRAFALLAVVLLLGADSKDDVKKDRKKLEGTWQVVTEVVDGNDRPEDEVKNLKVFFDADGNWRAENDGKVIFKGTSVIDPSKKPKEIDETITTGPNKGKVFSAIYEIDDDHHKICFAASGKGRPTAFSSLNGSGHLLQVWKREKK